MTKRTNPKVEDTTTPVVTVSLRPLLTAVEVAERLGVPASVLERWRGTGEGPLYIKLSGKYIRYRTEDLETFVEGCRRQNTAE